MAIREHPAKGSILLCDFNQGFCEPEMVNTVGFHRLNFIHTGKNQDGKRLYYYTPLTAQQLRIVQTCVLHGMGLSRLTKLSSRI